MSFPRLSFPLTVDFGEAEYWIGEQGPCCLLYTSDAADEL